MKFKVGLVQINNSFSGQNYFPYSVGLLQSYAMANLKNSENYTFLPAIYSRIKILDIVERIKHADIVLFSIYVWNFKISMAIADELKKKNPKITIVAGGPHVPDHGTENFLRENPFLDMVCHGEGERVICPILENFFDKDSWNQIPSISYLKGGEYITNPKTERIRDLNEIPSPYLNGVFDELIKQNPQEKWLVMWETNRGCPYSCAFCDWGSATASKVFQFDIERLHKEIDWISKNKIEFIFCCDANYGIFPRDLEISEYVAENKRKFGYPKALSVQNAKNAKENTFQIQKTLSDSGLNKGVTLSLQSVDETTLKNIKRSNIKTDVFQNLQTRFTESNIETYTDLILGMPGETYDSFVEGISSVVGAGQHNRIQFNNLSILPNAEMGNPEYQKAHEMEIVESKIINIHGSLLDNEEVYETQKLVVATRSTPREDWIKTRAYSWLVALIHFDKLLQIPIIISQNLSEVLYREIFDLFLKNDSDNFPVFSRINDFFKKEAELIQKGGPEYCVSKEWLNIYWPADEYIFIDIVKNNEIDRFYEEAENILKSFLKSKLDSSTEEIVSEAIQLNKQLIKKPFISDDLLVKQKFNLWDVYRSALIGENLKIKSIDRDYIINRTNESWNSWDDWYREVVWYGNKKGAYLYKLREVDKAENEEKIPELEGHY
ncbi:MAG: cobalamin-dependent protein [Leptospiraceae bacterium]|nr:cobalamin-dependent protein [Leptospiraceae bacterium]